MARNVRTNQPEEVAVSPEEVIAELERKVERLATALDILLDAINESTIFPIDVVIAAGSASNVLKGIEG